MPASTTAETTQPDNRSRKRKLTAILLIVAAPFAVAFLVGLFQGYQRGSNERQALDNFAKSNSELATNMQSELERNGYISPESTATAMEVLKTKLDTAATQGGKNQKDIVAFASVMAEVQKKFAPYAVLAKRIETANPMDMSTVRDKSDLLARLKLGQEMQQMNAELLKFLDPQAIEALFRTKLVQLGTTGDTSEARVKAFMTGYAKSAAITRKIRMTDDTIAQSMIATMTLMEREWGKWKIVNDAPTFDVAERKSVSKVTTNVSARTISTVV